MKNFLTILAATALAACMPVMAAQGQTVQAPRGTPNMPAPMNFGPKEALTIRSVGQAHNFMVEVADTPAERSRGMMFRDVINPGEGMLFEFERNQVASIWMKNTSVFLDVLFVRGDGRIVKIEHSAKPYSLRSMTSEIPVAGVLELAGGEASRLGIRPGDIIEHEFFRRR